jgi:NAD(P)-dependent dehydrogenase (short-subunit alcohol dehydrogenase family)
MTQTEAVEKNLSDDFKSFFLKHIPLKKIGIPEEIAKAVIYFASDDSTYTTGQILAISGGFGLATPIYGDLSNKNIKR